MTDLNEILKHKELKQELIFKLIQKNQMPVLVVRVNIPGPEKKTPWAKQLFQAAEDEVKKTLDQKQWSFYEMDLEMYFEYLKLFSVKADAVDMKLAAIELEESHEIGRILDVDVYDLNGVIMTRQSFQKSPRSCYICDRPAYECVRNQTHPVEELTEFLISKAMGL